MKAKVSLAVLILLSTVLLSACARTRGPEHFYFGNYSEAEQLYSKGEFEKAIAKYQAYVDENPEGNLAVIAQYYMGKSYAALGQNEQARELYQKIAKEYPDLVWANFAETQLKELDKS